jgi:hypothetical protein
MDLSRFKAASRSGEDRAPIANTLIREMAVHSDAEEISIYNEMDSFGFGDVAAHNRGEYTLIAQINSPTDCDALNRGARTNQEDGL